MQFVDRDIILIESDYLNLEISGLSLSNSDFSVSVNVRNFRYEMKICSYKKKKNKLYVFLLMKIASNVSL